MVLDIGYYLVLLFQLYYWLNDAAIDLIDFMQQRIKNSVMRIDLLKFLMAFRLSHQHKQTSQAHAIKFFCY